MKALLKTLIEKRILDYRALVLDFYPKFDLTEKEAIVLIRLNQLLEQKQEVIKPQKFAKLTQFSLKETETLLASLMQKGYLKIALIETKEGKEKEVFDIDFFLIKVIDYLEKKHNEAHENVIAKVVSYIEDTFQKEIKPLDVELISDWILKEGYPFEMIKEATLDALKSHYPTVRKIDQMLIKETEKIPLTPKKKDVLKEFHKLWDE